MCLCMRLPIVPYITCERTAKALVKLWGCTGSSEPSLLTYVISNLFTLVGSSISASKRVWIVPSPLLVSCVSLIVRCSFFFFFCNFMITDLNISRNWNLCGFSLQQSRPSLCLQVISNAYAHHNSVISGKIISEKNEVHSLISQY